MRMKKRTPQGLLREALQTSFSPFEVRCREKEQTRIKNFLGMILIRANRFQNSHTHTTSASCVKNGHGSSMYICGSPGTGKTLSVDFVCREVFGHDPKTRTIKINAMTLTKPQEVYVELLKKLCGPQKGSVSPSEAAKSLQHEFLNSKKNLT